MQLRNHPLMSYNGLSNWPPRRANGRETVLYEGGILKSVLLHECIPDKCFLRIEHEGECHIDSLAFDDATFCKHITDLLEFYTNCPIKGIGTIDVAHLPL